MTREEFLLDIKKYVEYCDSYLETKENSFPLKVDEMMNSICVEFKMNQKDMYKIDNLIRMYLADHSKYKIGYGRYGGIQLKENKLKVSDEVNKEIQAEIERRVNERMLKSNKAMHSSTSFLDEDIKKNEQ